MGKVIQNEWHHLLLRQLDKTDTCIDKEPKFSNWLEILSKINDSYLESDQERYLLERSLSISSSEMQELHQKTQQHAEQWVKDISNNYPDMLILISEDGIVLDLLSSNGFENLIINPNFQESNQPLEFILNNSLSQSIRKHLSKISNEHNSDTYEFSLNSINSQTIYAVSYTHLTLPTIYSV